MYYFIISSDILYNNCVLYFPPIFVIINSQSLDGTTSFWLWFYAICLSIESLVIIRQQASWMVSVQNNFHLVRYLNPPIIIILTYVYLTLKFYLSFGSYFLLRKILFISTNHSPGNIFGFAPSIHHRAYIANPLLALEEV